MSEKISARHGVLCGFADLFERPAAVAAAWTVVGKAATKGKRPAMKAASIAFHAAAGAEHGKAAMRGAAQRALQHFSRARDAGARAQAVGQKLAAAVKAYDAEAKAGKHKPLVAIHGDTAIGAGALSPAAAMAAIKQAKAAQRHAALAAAARGAAPRVLAAGSAAAKAAEKARSRTAALVGANGDGSDQGGAPPAGPGVPQWDRVSGQVTDGSGQVLYPGYAAAGDYPPGFDSNASVATYTDPNGVISVPDGATPAPGGSPAFDPANPPGQVVIPQRDQPLSKEDAKQVLHSVPADAVRYAPGTLARDWPDMIVGSWSFFYGPQYGGQGGGGQFGAAPRQIFANKGWIVAEGVGFGGSLAWKGPFDKDMDAWNECLALQTNVPAVYPTVPFIGNPNDQLKGLQFCPDTGDWFWQAQHAPSSVTGAQDAAARAANAAAADSARKVAIGLAQAAIDTIKKTAVANAAEIYGAAVQAAKDAAAAAEAAAKADADAALQARADAASTAHAQAMADAADIAAQQQQAAQAAQIDLDARRQALAERQAQALADAAAQADQGYDQGYAQPDQGYQPPPPDYSAPAPDYSAPTPVDYGDQGGDYAVPDPNNPGYLTDGSPDPGWNGGADDAAAASGQPQGGGGEADSALEAAAIDSGGGDDSGDALIGSDGEAPIDGAGRVIGIDQWGNTID